jgi:hypothetical protein
MFRSYTMVLRGVQEPIFKVLSRTDSLSGIWSYVTLSAARQSGTFSHQGESSQMLE